MAKIIYQKLVRDLIPFIIKSAGKKAIVRKLEIQERETHVKNKLREETEELYSAATKNEILKESSDLLEVIYAYASLYGITPAEIESVRQKREASRGAFKEWLFLDSVFEGDCPQDSNEKPE